MALGSIAWGNIIYQLFLFVILILIIGAVYRLIRSAVVRKQRDMHMEKKLDTIIELLKKQRGE
ncbi:DUF4083 family protein [Ectobacillus ponti]|uniref:DUF4083 family protein n=1 Tax=Ectobacillus ponti TaxID=2961894 RepID=UPI0034D308FE